MRFGWGMGECSMADEGRGGSACPGFRGWGGGGGGGGGGGLFLPTLRKIQ